MIRRSLSLVCCVALLTAAAQAQAGTIYTSDPVLAHETAGVTNYATFSNFFAGDVGSPFTPSSSELDAHGYRVYDGGSITGLPGSNWILATFASPESMIRVFPNVDHFGSAYDGYQYSVAGSNDGTTWTQLYDTLTVAGASEPFTIGTFTGTAPTRVNNVLTPGSGSTNGILGYEADFTFGSAYKYYAFGASTEAVNAGNSDQELSAVSTAPVPEPAAWLPAATALVGLFAWRRRARVAASACK
jgi:MYXO-CTERM domain-containing protein